MSVGFAGSARTGERRRRRLATETDAPASKAKRRHRVDPAHVEPDDDEASPLALGESPLHGFLPQRRWLLVGATLFSFWGVLAAIYFALVGEFDPRWQPIVGIDHGHLIPTLGVVLLVGSVQCCYIIYWYRKRGRREFAGDYRRYGLAGLTFLLALPCWAGGLHHLIGATLSPRLPAAAWNTPDLCWMIPLGTAAALYGFGLLREMFPIRLRGLLLVAGLIWLTTAAVTRLSGPGILAPIACERLAKIATLLAFWSFFHSLWLQARHVLRVTNEPLRQESFQPLAIRQAVETGLGAVERAHRLATSPSRLMREAVSTWRERRIEAAAERDAQREARREAKAAAKVAAKADREAAKQAKIEAKELAKLEREEAKLAAADDKRRARQRAEEEKRLDTKAKRDAADDAGRDDQSEAETAPPSPAESRGRRRGRGPSSAADVSNEVPDNASPSGPSDPSEAPPADEDEEDLSHLSRKERRRLRKQRQRHN